MRIQKIVESFDWRMSVEVEVSIVLKSQAKRMTGNAGPKKFIKR